MLHRVWVIHGCMGSRGIVNLVGLSGGWDDRRVDLDREGLGSWPPLRESGKNWGGDLAGPRWSLFGPFTPALRPTPFPEAVASLSRFFPLSYFPCLFLASRWTRRVSESFMTRSHCLVGER